MYYTAATLTQELCRQSLEELSVGGISGTPGSKLSWTSRNQSESKLNYLPTALTGKENFVSISSLFILTELNLYESQLHPLVKSVFSGALLRALVYMHDVGIFM